MRGDGVIIDGCGGGGYGFECHCDCHRYAEGVVHHIINCCWSCSKCGKKRIIDIESHREVCRDAVPS